MKEERISYRQLLLELEPLLKFQPPVGSTFRKDLHTFISFYRKVAPKDLSEEISKTLAVKFDELKKSYRDACELLRIDELAAMKKKK